MTTTTRPESIRSDNGFVIRNLLTGKFDGCWYPTFAAATAACDTLSQIERSDEARMARGETR